jgi:hypothetical protein
MVAGANSYASVATLRQYALDHGITVLPTDDTAATVLLYQARDYIEAREWRFQGSRNSAVLGYYNSAVVQQALSFPRYPDSTIPAALVSAQCQLACDLTGVAGFAVPQVGSNNVKRKTVGPITTEYFSPATPTPIFPQVDALLRPLFAARGVATMRA